MKYCNGGLYDAVAGTGGGVGVLFSLRKRSSLYGIDGIIWHLLSV